MIICRNIPELRTLVDGWLAQNLHLGLVPTMGYLHEGHLSLVDLIKSHCDRIIVSIFVNPTQFAPNEDYDSYPRDFERDEKLLIERGADAIFYPTVQEMYPRGFRTFVQVEELGEVLCGRSRPTHFRGVATVVTKLFLLSKCHVAAFGQKDYQQALIIKKMVEDLNFDLDIIVGPIVREADGLAMSSRNRYLSAEERKRAVCLYRALSRARDIFLSGQTDTRKLRREMKNIVLSTPQVSIDYLEIVDAASLQPLQEIDRPALLAGAIRVGKTRLIDNILVEP